MTKDSHSTNRISASAEKSAGASLLMWNAGRLAVVRRAFGRDFAATPTFSTSNTAAPESVPPPLPLPPIEHVRFLRAHKLRGSLSVNVREKEERATEKVGEGG